MVTYANGRIPQSALSPIPSIGGTAWLLPAPAAAFLAVCADVVRQYGWAPVATSPGDGFRSYDRQRTLFLQRYAPVYATVVQGGRRIVDRRTWDGVYYWRHTGAAAAVPGTSNHGKGITVDVTGLGAYTSTRFRQFAAVAAQHGFSNAEGRSVGEPWHWNYTRAITIPVSNTNTAPEVSITLPDGTAPDPLKEDEVARLARRANGVDYAIVGPGAQFTTLGTVDQLRTAVGLSMVTGVTVKDGPDGLVVEGEIELLDDLMWNSAVAIAQRWRDQNTR